MINFLDVETEKVGVTEWFSIESMHSDICLFLIGGENEVDGEQFFAGYSLMGQEIPELHDFVNNAPKHAFISFEVPSAIEGAQPNKSMGIRKLGNYFTVNIVENNVNNVPDKQENYEYIVKSEEFTKAVEEMHELHLSIAAE